MRALFHGLKNSRIPILTPLCSKANCAARSTLNRKEAHMTTAAAVAVVDATAKAAKARILSPSFLVFGILGGDDGGSQYLNGRMSISPRQSLLASDRSGSAQAGLESSYHVDWLKVKIPESSTATPLNVLSTATHGNESREGDMQPLVAQLLEQAQKENDTSSDLGQLSTLSSSSPTNTPPPFVVFDATWNPIFFSSRKTSLDSAMILHAATQRQHEELESEGATSEDPREEANEQSGPAGRTLVANKNEVHDMVNNGDLPLVPVRRSSVTQLLTQQSVNLFFHRESVRFFACQPYRFSPRTFYRFPAAACKGYVALTIDDAPCRFDRHGNSKLPEVLQLLQKHEARATFMAIEQYLSYPTHEADLVRLLQEGHELANHGIRDEAMDALAAGSTVSNPLKRLSFHRTSTAEKSVGEDSASSKESGLEAFLKAIDQCNLRIEELQEKALGKRTSVKWFRAPHGKYNKNMEQGLEKRDMFNVMCDAYAVDPIVENGKWIGQSLLRQTSDGSIILLHMPEKGFRDYCFVALETLLEGLSQRNLKVVSVTELEEIAMRAQTE